MDLKTLDKLHFAFYGSFVGTNILAILEVAYEPTRFNEYVMIAVFSIGMILNMIIQAIRFKKLKENFVQNIKP